MRTTLTLTTSWHTPAKCFSKDKGNTIDLNDVEALVSAEIWLLKTHCIETGGHRYRLSHISTPPPFPDMNPLRPVYLAVLAAACTLNCANAIKGNDADPMELEVSQKASKARQSQELRQAITANA